VLLIALAAVASAQERTFNVPSESAALGIPEFARQAGIQIIAPVGQLHGVNTAAVQGKYDVRRALDVLLAGTGLEVASDKGDIIALQKAATADPQSDALSEIIVTATKRPEELRKIAGSVSALTGEDLAAVGAEGFADYLARTPGVVFNAAVPGDSPIVIRGVSTTTNFDQGEGTTAYFINDVPLTDPFFSVAIADVDTFDVDNVTVLRGPQGTLFGSASLGGAVNYQATKPNLSQYQFHLQSTFEGIEDGGIGGSGKVMLNLPLISDVFAIRGVFIYRQDPGYIDNLGTGQHDSNDTLFRGGRLQATWAPTPSTTVSYLFLDQTEDTPDLGYAEPGYAGNLAKNTVIPEVNDYSVLVHNLRLDQDLGFATLTAMASYHEDQQSTVTDLTTTLDLPGISPVAYPQQGTGKGTSFEARLASATGGPFEYLVGLFRNDTREPFNIIFDAPGAPPGALAASLNALIGPGAGAAIVQPGNILEHDNIGARGQENALFGEASYHVTPQWKLTFGGRLYNTTIDDYSQIHGFFPYLDTGGAQTIVAVNGRERDTGFLPKGSVTWTPDDALMVYGLVSTGFRYGGPNINASATGVQAPPTYKPDSLTNYELGTRTNWLERRLELDATAFYIDWSNIQLRQYAGPGDLFGVNAGKARNYGLEGTGAWRITPDLTLRSSVTYLDAKLIQAFNPGGGLPVDPAGATLPGASRWQVASSLAYQWRSAPLEPTFNLSQRYISTAPGSFGGLGLPQGGYVLVDGRATFTARNFQVTGFVKNIGNSHGITNANLTGNPPPAAQIQEYLVQPRTFGITLDYKWGY
jgi:iron complex outermembrane recepter protein